MGLKKIKMDGPILRPSTMRSHHHLLTITTMTC